MERILTSNENPNGLHLRYFIAKWIKGLENKIEWPLERRIQAVDKNAEYFILRLDDKGSDPKHIAACRIGVNAYADAIKDHLPELSKDLKERYPVSTPSTSTGLQDRNFMVRLKANIDRRMTETGIKEMMLEGINTSQKSFSETWKAFFESLEDITLETLQGKNPNPQASRGFTVEEMIKAFNDGYNEIGTGWMDGADYMKEFYPASLPTKEQRDQCNHSQLGEQC